MRRLRERPLRPHRRTLFTDYGGKRSFCGQIVTVKVFEDNVLVRAALEEAGQERVLVVDGGASLNCALLGDQVAQLACDNDWAGLVINGCIRNSSVIAAIPLGVKALNTSPRRSKKEGKGEKGCRGPLCRRYLPPGPLPLC